jgi:hypothetical protein
MEKIKVYFICPITHELMEDPVIDHEGNNYEYSAISKWLQTHNTSGCMFLLLQIAQYLPCNQKRHSEPNLHNTLDLKDLFIF